MKTVVSVSLGSSSRDHRAQVELLGEQFDISREGMDGSLDRALKRLRELDGTVDAIGLGGIDVYLYAGTQRFALRDGLRLLNAVKTTPVVDGSGLKNTLEREAVEYLQRELGLPLRGKRVLMVSALDRFGMAQALVAAGADMIFGDFIFALDLDRPVRGLDEFEEMARKYLPDACKLPFQFFYPTGKKQDRDAGAEISRVLRRRRHHRGRLSLHAPVHARPARRQDGADQHADREATSTNCARAASRRW